MGRRGFYVRCCCCVLLVPGLMASCARQPQAPSMRSVTLPDLSAASPAVQAKIKATFATLQPRAESYGELGRVLLAAEYFDAAEVAFEDARALAPGDRRWPYYLAHVYRYRQDAARASQWFNAALKIQPDDVPSLAWLGEMELAQGHVAAAQAAFERALSLDSNSAAARYGLGRAALARRDYPQAIDHLQAALRLAPQASRVHYPLGLAYQGAGDQARAQAEFRLRGDADLAPADPLMAQLGALLDDAPAHERRGAAALEQQQWSVAASELRQAISLAPDRPYAHLNLGTALYMSGDVNAAIEQFRDAARLSPSLANAHYSLGVIFGSEGRDADAVSQLTQAVQADPMLLQARLELANALRRGGRPEASLPHYMQVLDAQPAESSARFGYAMALVQLHRYRQARDWLDAASKQSPEQPGFGLALARILAAAPDGAVRDGARAVTLANAALSATRSLAAGETLAMALAETGRFDDAARLQQQVLAAAEKAGQADVARRLRANLDRYTTRQPCRVPWADDDPVFHPRPSDAALRMPAGNGPRGEGR